ncbi:MAG TPA: efflux RND transporter permease subunit, partial [Gammaproteobacteria bacterium]
KLPTQILPSFLLAVGVGATVHLLAIFFRHYQKSHDKEESIAYTLGHSGLAIVMTSLTTAAGLASFAGTPVAPISDLGFFSAAGVLIALFYSLVLLPALLAIMPLKSAVTKGASARHERMDRFLLAVADFAVNRYRAILAVSAVIFVFALAGVVQVRFSHMPLHWLHEDEPLRQATSYIDDKMKGSSTVEVIVKTGRENGLYEPVVLNGLETMRSEVEAIHQGALFVGKTQSVADILKETNRALNENRAEAYVLPQERDLIAQEFLLFENSGSDDLEDFVDSGFTQARFTAKTPWLDSLVYPPFIRTIEEKARTIFGDNAEITITGTAALFGRTFAAAIESTAQSYLWAFLIITAMMIALVGNLRMGLISMIPNLVPVFLTIGLMGWLGIPLDMFTMLIGSIAIGLAVDDTIHFMHNYRRYHHSSGDVKHAVEQTLLGAGRAMLVTSIVLSTGFFIYMFSNLNNLFAFGLLTGFTIITALVADFLLTPALMTAMSSRLMNEEEDHRYEDAEDESHAA